MILFGVEWNRNIYCQYRDLEKSKILKVQYKTIKLHETVPLKVLMIHFDGRMYIIFQTQTQFLMTQTGSKCTSFYYAFEFHDNSIFGHYSAEFKHNNCI